LILVDSNVWMYAAGSAHPHRAPSQDFVRAIAGGDVHGVVDAEVLQEILHRYRAMGRWQDGRELFDLVRRIAPEVLPVTGEVLDQARSLLDGHAHLSARDALHAAVALGHGAEAICSYDRDFDAIPGLARITPDDWRDEGTTASHHS